MRQRFLPADRQFPGGRKLNDRDRATLLHYYNENLRRYGYDPRSLGWLEGTQPGRFDVLAGIGDLEGCSVLDVGCGFGDFYGYLCRRGIHVDYTGLDLNPGFVEIAKGRHPEADFIIADFEEAGIRRRFDWAFESGIFNLRVSGHEAYVRKVLEKMYDASRYGFAADFLSDRGPRSAEMYHPRADELLGFCRRLSGRVRLRRDYKPTEFCVYVYRDGQP
jgi:SAM-dependent methyltransferase